MDKRVNNGNKGHSTISKGVDKRKNEYKNVLNEALTYEDLKEVIQMLHRKAVNDFDTNAAKILLEYYLGRPSQLTNIELEDKVIEISFKD